MFNHPVELEIGGVRVRSPKIGGITEKPERIWSKNTGRTGTQKMRGTVLDVKCTYAIEWPALTKPEKDLIKKLVSDKSKPFTTIRVREPDGSVWEMECYFGTPSFPEWEWLNGQWMCVGAKVDAIER